MLKWMVGGFVILVLLVLIIQPDWLNVFKTIFLDYIQANE